MNSYISFKDIFCVELQEALGGQLVFYSWESWTFWTSVPDLSSTTESNQNNIFLAIVILVTPKSGVESEFLFNKLLPAALEVPVNQNHSTYATSMLEVHAYTDCLWNCWNRIIFQKVLYCIGDVIDWGKCLFVNIDTNAATRTVILKVNYYFNYYKCLKQLCNCNSFFNLY